LETTLDVNIAKTDLLDTTFCQNSRKSQPFKQ